MVDIADGVIIICIAAVVMGVTAMILSKIFPSIQGFDDDSNATIAAIKSSTWDAIGLLPVALIVLAAVIIIGVVMYLKYSGN